LTETFASIKSGQADLVDKEQSLDALGRQARSNGHGDMDRRLRDARSAAGKVREAIHNLLASIAEKDIEVRDVDMGLVDFPAEREGRDIWLCWRPGERAVAYWHEIDRGFRDRKPL
jgi:hypothetical protein